MKFQHLILPLVLWLLVGLGISTFVPESPLIVGIMLILISFATYFSVRVATRSKLTIIAAAGVFIFLLSSVLSGFSFINLLLIAAIATLISQLVNPPASPK